MVHSESSGRRAAPDHRVSRSFAALARRAMRHFAWRGLSGQFLREEDGGSLIEFALVSSTMMMSVLVLMQLCIAFYSYGMISECAREATRYAIVRGSTCLTSSSTSCTATTTSVSNYAKGLGYPNIGGGTMSVTTNYPDGNEAPGSRVKVEIAYTVPITLPLVPKNAISLQTVSEMYILQ